MRVACTLRASRVPCSFACVFTTDMYSFFKIFATRLVPSDVVTHTLFFRMHSRKRRATNAVRDPFPLRCKAAFARDPFRDVLRGKDMRQTDHMLSRLLLGERNDASFIKKTLLTRRLPSIVDDYGKSPFCLENVLCAAPTPRLWETAEEKAESVVARGDGFCFMITGRKRGNTFYLCDSDTKAIFCFYKDRYGLLSNIMDYYSSAIQAGRIELCDITPMVNDLGQTDRMVLWTALSLDFLNTGSVTLDTNIVLSNIAILFARSKSREHRQSSRSQLEGFEPDSYSSDWDTDEDEILEEDNTKRDLFGNVKLVIDNDRSVTIPIVDMETVEDTLLRVSRMHSEFAPLIRKVARREAPLRLVVDDRSVTDNFSYCHQRLCSIFQALGIFNEPGLHGVICDYLHFPDLRAKLMTMTNCSELCFSSNANQFEFCVGYEAGGGRCEVLSVTIENPHQKPLLDIMSQLRSNLSPAQGKTIAYLLPMDDTVASNNVRYLNLMPHFEINICDFANVEEIRQWLLENQHVDYDDATRIHLCGLKVVICNVYPTCELPASNFDQLGDFILWDALAKDIHKNALRAKPWGMKGVLSRIKTGVCWDVVVVWIHCGRSQTGCCRLGQYKTEMLCMWETTFTKLDELIPLYQNAYKMNPTNPHTLLALFKMFVTPYHYPSMSLSKSSITKAEFYQSHPNATCGIGSLMAKQTFPAAGRNTRALVFGDYLPMALERSSFMMSFLIKVRDYKVTVISVDGGMDTFSPLETDCSHIILQPDHSYRCQKTCQLARMPMCFQPRGCLSAKHGSHARQSTVIIDLSLSIKSLFCLPVSNVFAELKTKLSEPRLDCIFDVMSSQWSAIIKLPEGLIYTAYLLLSLYCIMVPMSQKFAVNWMSKTVLPTPTTTKTFNAQQVADFANSGKKIDRSEFLTMTPLLKIVDECIPTSFIFAPPSSCIDVLDAAVNGSFWINYLGVVTLCDEDST